MPSSDTPDLAPLDPSDIVGSSMASRVAHELRTAIVEGTLSPLERIKQDTVAKRLGVSRNPVREALQILATEGLVTLERDVGARVAALDPKDLLEVFLIREALEPLAVVEATPHVDAVALDDLSALNEQGERYAERGDVAGYLMVDREFHARMFAASGMVRLCSTIRSLSETARRYLWLYTILPQRLEISVVEHRMILDAIGRGAAEDAGELHRIHIHRTRLTLTEHQEFFRHGSEAGA